MTGIVDYNAGNIKSVERALSFLKAPYVLSKNPKDLENCDRIIFPGVGEAKYAMEQLRLTGFDAFLKDWASAQKQLLGICLGSQIIFEHSSEGDVDCLGILKGETSISRKSGRTMFPSKFLRWAGMTFRTKTAAPRSWTAFPNIPISILSTRI